MEDKNMVEEKEILNIENLRVRFETEDGVVYAVNGVNLKLGYKKTLGLVGETGAGKTTTALAMLRLVPDPPGVVECDRLEIDGQDIRTMSITSLEEVRGKEISMIFQDLRLMALLQSYNGTKNGLNLTLQLETDL